MGNVGHPTDVGDPPISEIEVEASDNTETVAILNDETNCSLLAMLTETPRSVSELASMLEKSPSTIYRHIASLQSHGLVAEGTELDRDGHHRNVYRTAVRRVEIKFVDETMTVTIERRDDAVERFSRLWTQMRGDQ